MAGRNMITQQLTANRESNSSALSCSPDNVLRLPTELVQRLPRFEGALNALRQPVVELGHQGRHPAQGLGFRV